LLGSQLAFWLLPFRVSGFSLKSIARSEIEATPVETLTPRQARAEHKLLATEIAAADLAYHQNDAPILDDATYDAKRRRLVAIETAYPALKPDDALTDKVAGQCVFR
jgi:DNA ligase (NAD+)